MKRLALSHIWHPASVSFRRLIYSQINESELECSRRPSQRQTAKALSGLIPFRRIWEGLVKPHNRVGKQLSLLRLDYP